jgi:hypothetical protein
MRDNLRIGQRLQVAQEWVGSSMYRLEVHTQQMARWFGSQCTLGLVYYSGGTSWFALGPALKHTQVSRIRDAWVALSCCAASGCLAARAIVACMACGTANH